MSRTRKAAATAFILFHGYCVATWVFPGPSAALAFLASPRLPFSEGRLLVPTYMHLTGQHQGWMLFAPNPLQHNRYVSAVVVRRDGTRESFAFPRLSDVGAWEAWIEKRWRRYQHAIAEFPFPAYREDLARWIARRRFDPANPPVRVVVLAHEAPIPRHDRPSAVAPSVRVKDPSAFVTRVLIDCRVPEDGR